MWRQRWCILRCSRDFHRSCFECPVHEALDYRPFLRAELDEAALLYFSISICDLLFRPCPGTDNWYTQRHDHVANSIIIGTRMGNSSYYVRNPKAEPGLVAKKMFGARPEHEQVMTEPDHIGCIENPPKGHGRGSLVLSLTKINSPTWP